MGARKTYETAVREHRHGKGVRRPPRWLLLGAVVGGLFAIWVPFLFGFGLIHTYADSSRYTDATLGFSLHMATGWEITPHKGTDATADMATVALSKTSGTPLDVLVTVRQGSNMPSQFASQVAATTTIGTYLASARSYGATEQMPTPCEERIFLAGNDYVDATWCGANAATESATIESLLGTFQPPAPGWEARAKASTARAGLPNGNVRQAVIPKAQTCLALQHNDGYGGTPAWGTELAAPTATAPLGGWATLSPAVSICSNTISPDTWLFQCTELVNRFLRERWGLGALPETGDMAPGMVAGYLGGNAGMYLDWWGDAGNHQPQHYPGSANGKSDTVLYSDARWAAQLAPYGYHSNATRPVPGDVLVWQDVSNPAQGPISGTPARRYGNGYATSIYPGHVAIVTASNATTLTLAQQNYNDATYFSAVSISPASNGGWVIDPNTAARTHDPAGIFVGWIHFSEASATGLVTSPSLPNTHTTPAKVHLPSNLAAPTPVVTTNTAGQPEVFARTTTEQIVHATSTRGVWSGWDAIGDTTPIASDPALATDAAVYARSDGDNQIRQSTASGGSWTPWQVIGGVQPGGFVGNPILGPTPTSGDANTRAVYALGADRHLYMTYLQHGTWFPWQRVGDATPIAGEPAFVGPNFVFARSATDNLILVTVRTVSGWSNWRAISNAVAGGFVGSPVASIPPSQADSQFPELYAASAQGHVYTTYVVGGVWLPWQQIGGSAPIVGDPIPLNGSLIYARTAKDNQIRQTVQTGSTWSDWQTLGGSLPFGFVGDVATLLPSGQADAHFAMVFAVDEQGDLLTTNYQNGRYISWQQVGDASVFFA